MSRALEGRQAFQAAVTANESPRGSQSLPPFQGLNTYPPSNQGFYPWLITCALPGLSDRTFGGPGVTERTLKSMGRLAVPWPEEEIVQQVVAQIPGDIREKES